jgi:hypothetical protein
VAPAGGTRLVAPGWWHPATLPIPKSWKTTLTRSPKRSVILLCGAREAESMNVTIEWDEANDPRGNVELLRQIGVTQADVEHAVELGATDPDVSNMSGWPVLFGAAEDGRPMAVMFRWEDASTIYVIGVEVGE